VHTSVTVAESNRDGLERLKVDEAAEAIAYAARVRPGHGPRGGAAPIDAQEVLARVVMHIPEPRLHVIR
jgi:hypothetical protein